MAHDDTMQTKLDKLDAMLAQTSTSKQDATLVAEMLSLPNDGRYPALELEPQQRRQKTLEALTAHVETLSRQNPLLMTFEDVHWTDPSSIVFGVVGRQGGRHVEHDLDLCNLGVPRSADDHFNFDDSSGSVIRFLCSE